MRCHVKSGLALLSAIFALTGCVDTHVKDTASASEPASNCGVSITPGSALAKDIAALTKSPPKCARFTDTSDRSAHGLKAIGKLDPSLASIEPGAHDYAERLLLIAIVYDEPIPVSSLPAMDPKKLELSAVRRVGVGEEASLSTPSATINGIFAAIEPETSIGYACLVADKMSVKAAPMRIILCRSVDRSPSDGQIIQKAGAIARDDLPNVNA